MLMGATVHSSSGASNSGSSRDGGCSSCSSSADCCTGAGKGSSGASSSSERSAVSLSNDKAPGLGSACGCPTGQPHGVSSNKARGGGVVMPLLLKVLRSFVTLAVLLLLAELLFWPPLEACAADVNGIAELSDGLTRVAAGFVHNAERVWKRVVV